MYDRILFPTDGSEGAKVVFDHVLDIAATHGATLYIINVADTAHDSVTRIGGEVIDVLEREGERIVNEAATRAEEHDVGTVTDVQQGGVPETITSYAEEYSIDLITVPTHGRTGLERALLGSVAERIIRRATVPVLSLRPDDESSPYRNVLVPTDGSVYADAALQLGVKFANTVDTPLHLLFVVDTPSLGVDAYSARQMDALDVHANTVINEATAFAERAAVESVIGTIEQGASVPRTINAYVDDHAIGLVVMGTHGRTGVDRYLLGSITEKVVRTASVPIVTVPEPDQKSALEDHRAE